MAYTDATAWTNLTLDLFRDNPHVDCKPILKNLVEKTVSVGIRFVSQQTKATEGVRPVRLDAWKYIRKVSMDDMLKAMREAGCSSYDLQEGVRKAMSDQNVYHVVIRGNDPKFMPLGKVDGQDIVTNYISEQLDFVHEEVEKMLFEFLDDPQAIKQAMSDTGFDKMLEHYFRGGDMHAEETLHVVSRFNGGNNLLHTCIKEEGHLATLQLLLDSYTLESHGQQTRWRVLAEPLRPCGKYKISAFHRAVFDGRTECLEALVAWAKQHGHDITGLRNVEERNVINESVKGLTCLELAEQEGNLACFNILAPLFGAAVKLSGTDATTRAARLAERATPRLELAGVGSEAEPLRTMPVDDHTDWTELLRVSTSLMSCEECLSQERGTLTIRALNMEFVDDASEEFFEKLFTAVAGLYSFEVRSSTLKTDRTGLNALRVLVRTLGSANGGILPAGVPCKIWFTSAVAEDLSPAEEVAIDAQMGQQLYRLVELAGLWPGFLGAHNGLMGAKQRRRIAGLPNPEIAAASWAAVYTSRVAAFLRHNQDNDEDERGLETWIRTRTLMPVARAVQMFLNSQVLLSSGSEDPRRACDPAVIHFLQSVLRGWFATVPLESTNDIWSAWAQRCEVDSRLMKEQLALALDNLLESLLRMWKVLDPLCKDSRAASVKVSSIAELLRACVPEPLFARLPNTRDRLEKYHSTSAGQGKKRLGGQVSLLSLTSCQSLRPGGR